MLKKSKICSNCKEEKEINYFYKRKDSIDGYRNNCKVCQDKKSEEYKFNNPEKIKNYLIIWNKNNPYKKEEYNKDYFIKNYEKEKKRKIKYYEDNKEKTKDYYKDWCTKNKEKIKGYSKKWYKNNQEEIKKQKLIWKENNPNYYTNYIKERNKNDYLFKLSHNVRTMITNSLKKNGYSKKSKTYNILGCSYEFLLKYIQSQWSLKHNLNENGDIWMNWDNHGLYKKNTFNYGWDIDHIIPISSAKTEEELLKLFHYSNQQPLCSKVNRDVKKNKT